MKRTRGPERPWRGAPVRWPRIDFPPGGLVPTIVQDGRDGTVLLLAYSSAASYRAMRRRNDLVLYSRSRRRLWRKGATSGHTARVVAASADCDADALLLKVLPRGPLCHTGRRSCFGEILPGEELQNAPVLARLARLVEARKRGGPAGSYTRRLLRDDAHRLKKVGEEASELVVASALGDREQVVWEAADLLYHVTVLLAASGVGWAEVLRSLGARAAGPRGPARRPRPVRRGR